MAILFKNLNPRFKSGMDAFLKKHNSIGIDTELNIQININNNKKIKIIKEKNNIIFELDKEYQVFRAITLLEQYLCNEELLLEECCSFDTLGAMFDGSQASSLMTNESYKKMMLILAGMGYNMMMLYCEDCYSVDGEPYWGNMRPRYTKEDFQELDNFAYSLGIELIPCMQTLGHLSEAIKKPPYAKISDTADILMVGNDDGYKLIEKLIVHMSSCFRSRRIHLGLDEAWNLGLGNYLKKNGYRNQTDIMYEHVEKVYKIATKHGLTPMMWADMFFRAKQENGGYHDTSIEFSDEDRKKVPENMQLVYWDYYHHHKREYVDMINQHRQINDNIIFAGCSRNVCTFGSHHNKTIVTTNAALSACKETGIKEVFATVWGDDHRESTTFATLPGFMLYAEHMYNNNPDISDVEKRFEVCVGAKYQMFADIGDFDCIPEYNGDNLENVSPSKVCMWQDILLGLCDYDLQGMNFSKHYSNLADKMKRYSEECSEFRTIFKFYAQLAKVLETKAYMGIRLVNAYKNKDTNELYNISKNVLPKLYDNMCTLRKYHREYFFEEYKPIGWEVLDIRYGGAIMRIDTAISRIEDYLDGKIDKIDELEEERLSLTGEGKLVPNMLYMQVCSASRLTS